MLMHCCSPRPPITLASSLAVAADTVFALPSIMRQAEPSETTLSPNSEIRFDNNVVGSVSVGVLVNTVTVAPDGLVIDDDPHQRESALDSLADQHPPICPGAIAGTALHRVVIPNEALRSRVHWPRSRTPP